MPKVFIGTLEGQKVCKSETIGLFKLVYSLSEIYKVLSFWQGLNKMPVNMHFLGVPISWSIAWENSVTSYHALCFSDDMAFFFLFNFAPFFSSVYVSVFPGNVCTNKLYYTCHTIKTWQIVYKTRLPRLHDVYQYHCHPWEKHGLFTSSRRLWPYMVYFACLLVRKICTSWENIPLVYFCDFASFSHVKFFWR